MSKEEERAVRLEEFKANMRSFVAGMVTRGHFKTAAQHVMTMQGLPTHELQAFQAELMEYALEMVKQNTEVQA